MNSLSLFYINDYTLSVISNPIKKMAGPPLTGIDALKIGSLPLPFTKARLLQTAKIRSAATKNLRIASWNVNGLTTKSEARVEIIKHVAEAIKLYKFDIVALQEIPSADAMSKLCEALNKDNPLQSWKCKSQQDNAKKLGFVWNSGIIKIEVQDLPFDYFARKPYHLKFKFEGITINLVNLHLTSRGNGQAKRKIEISKKINNDKEQDKLIDLVHSVCPTDQPGTLYQSSTLYQSRTLNQPGTLYQSSTLYQSRTLNQPGTLYQSRTLNQPGTLYQSRTLNQPGTLYQSRTLNQPGTLYQSRTLNQPGTLYQSRTLNQPGTLYQSRTLNQPGTLYQSRTLNQPGTYVFLIGDFNCFPWSKGLEMNKFVNLFPLRMYTNTKQDECYDNIIVPDKTLCRNVVVVTDRNLIKVSDHFPIYADFYFPTA